MVLMLSACSDPAPQPRTGETQPSAAELAKADADIGVKPVEAEPAAPIDSKTSISICMAAIAELFGHSPKIMKATPQDGSIIRISYKRPDDGKTFKNDCQIQGNRIMWRGVDIGSGTGPGRWRNNPADEVVTFNIVGKSVKILTTYSDGSVVAANQPLL
jgi:hypothetical protein